MLVDFLWMLATLLFWFAGLPLLLCLGAVFLEYATDKQGFMDHWTH